MFNLFAALILMVSYLWADITLKPIAIIKNDKIRVSDIFDGLEQEDNRVVRDAPLPGEKIYLHYEQLRPIAQNFGIPWQPLVRSKILIRRDSMKIPRKQLHDLVKTAVQKSNGDIFDSDTTDIFLDPDNSTIFLPTEKKVDIEIGSVEFSERKNHFTVTVKTPYQTYTLQGSIEKSIDIPVLKEPMKQGRIITINDIETIRIPLKNLGRAIIVKQEDLVGHRLRNGLCEAFQPIYEHQIETVCAIPKGAIVNMIVRVNSMEINAKGKTLEKGVMNDVIRVENIDSKKIVWAQVSGPQTVDVQEIADSPPPEA